MSHIVLYIDVNEHAVATRMTKEAFFVWWQSVRDAVEGCDAPYIAIWFSEHGQKVVPLQDIDELGGAKELFKDVQ